MKPSIEKLVAKEKLRCPKRRRIEEEEDPHAQKGIKPDPARARPIIDLEAQAQSKPEISDFICEDFVTKSKFSMTV